MDRAVLGWGLALGLTGAACGEVATFDDLAEGFTPTVMTSGGITFSHGLWFPGSVDLTFGIDNGSGDFPAMGYGGIYSSPNVMTVGGYVTGSQSAFFRVHSWEATAAGQLRNFASVDVFYINDFPETNVALEAWLGSELVAIDRFMITESAPGTTLHRELSVEGVMFDRIRFICTGGIFPGDANGILAVFDNVEMLVVPTPAAGIIALAALAVPRRRRDAR